MGGMSPAPESPFHCPRCINAKMLPQVWNGVPIHICLACGANFFHAGELAAWEGWSWDIPPSVEAAMRHRPAGVHCPSCHAGMEHLDFPLDPPLTVERCTACRGFLLDFEEIRRIPAIGIWAARTSAGGTRR